VKVTFGVGCTSADEGCETPPLAFEVSTADIQPPAELRDDSGSEPTVAELPCGPMGMCPSSPEASVSVSCEGGACDPAPTTITVPLGDVLELDLESEVGELFTRVDRIELIEARYQVERNTLTLDLGQVELFWGPPGALSVDAAMGVERIGTVPPLEAAAVRSGTVDLDEAGQRSLSDQLTEVGRVRFFARTSTDLDPGDPWPEGSLRVSMALRVQATGSML
jgi:hypothetical protein